MHARGSPEAAVSTSRQLPLPLRRLIASGLFLLFAPPLASAAAVSERFAPGTNTPVPHVSRGSSGVDFPESDLKPEAGLVRRGSAPFTFYNVGQGACGGFNSANDFVVAINSEQWDGGSRCYEPIMISCNGKQARAQIVDECEGCGPSGLDLSAGLFSYFADLDEGVIYGDWHFGGANSPTPTPTPTPKPQPQPNPKPAYVPTRVNNDVAAHTTKVGGAVTNSASKTKALPSLSTYTATSVASATGSAASASDASQSAQAPTPDIDVDSLAADPSATGEITSGDASDGTALPVFQYVSTSGAPSTAADQGTTAFIQGAAASRSAATGLQDINWALVSLGSLVSVFLQLDSRGGFDSTSSVHRSRSRSHPKAI